jgi:hypothetical protein
MATISSVYLKPNEPEHNLNLLVNYDPATPSGTFCMTQAVHKKISNWNPSKETIKEWTTHSAAAWILSSTILLPLAGMTRCMMNPLNLNDAWSLEGASKCLQTTVKAYDDGRAKMIGILSASLIGLTAIGVYAGARFYFRDSLQGDRFTALNTEYSNVAGYLQNQFSAAVASDDKEALRLLQENAGKLKANRYQIALSLQTAARMTAPQAKLLMHKLLFVADAILQSKNK